MASVVSQLTRKLKVELKNPIASIGDQQMFIPNHSGVVNHPELKSLLFSSLIGSSMSYDSSAILQLVSDIHGEVLDFYGNRTGWFYENGQTIDIYPEFVGGALDNGNGTMTLRNKNAANLFIRGTDSTTGSTGGATTITPTFTGSTTSSGAASFAGANNVQATVPDAQKNHTHSFIPLGTISTEQILPPFMRMNWIMRVY